MYLVTTSPKIRRFTARVLSSFNQGLFFEGDLEEVEQILLEVDWDLSLWLS
jgi:hypothetical protein